MLEYITIQNPSDAAEYGIALCDCGNMLRCIPGISGCRAEISELTALLNAEQVEPCHFEDVIEDYLTDFTL